MPNQSTRNPLLTKAYKVADSVLDSITHLPGGYSFVYGSLPHTGHGNVKAVRRQWVKVILAHMLPESFLDMVLLVVILPNGSPNSTASTLFQWLLTNRYNNNTQAMYADWLAKKG